MHADAVDTVNEAIAYWTAFMAIATAVTALIAVPALILSIVNFIASREPRVRWEVADAYSTGWTGEVRIVNRATKWVAHVIAMKGFQAGDDSADAEHGFHPSVSTPVDVEPGNWIHAVGMQFDGRERLRVDIEWQQRRVGSRKTRARVFRAALYI